MQVFHSANYRLTACLLLVWAVAALSASAQPKKDAPAKSIKLPSGAIIVLAKDFESLDTPEAVYLTPEKFRELNEQIETLRKQAAAEKAVPPNWCQVDGRLETRGTQTVARLTATFRFRTTSPRSVVFLGCQKAQPVEARQGDGKLPLLLAGDKGLSVLAEAEGEYTVTLTLDAPLQTKGGEVGFEIGLPAAPITLLKFDAPRVKRFTLSRREAPVAPATEAALDVKRVSAERLRTSNEGEALGPVNYLSLFWEETGQAAAPAQARSAEADVLVSVNDADITTEARLRLKGTAKEWRFLSPFDAEVAVGRAPASGTTGKPLDFPPDQVPDVIRPEPGKSEWRVRFKEPQSADLLAVVSVRGARNRDPKGRTVWPVGPFAILDGIRQEGTVRVRSQPNLRVTASLKGDTRKIDGGDDPGAESVYRYRLLQATGKDQYAPPLELDIRPATGIVLTQAKHSLQWADNGWRLHSEFHVTPLRAEVESLELEVPVAGFFEASTPKLVESLMPLRDVGTTGRVVQVRLTAPQRGEFDLALDGFYPAALAGQSAKIALPRPLNVFDRNGQVSINLPEGYDLQGAVFPSEADKLGARGTPLQPDEKNGGMMVATVPRSLSHLDLTWRPVQHDVRANLAADLILGDRSVQVNERMQLTFADRPQRRVRFRGPATVAGLAVTPGSVESPAAGEWVVTLPADAREASLQLSWSQPLSAGDKELSVPLLWPDGVNACESKLRLFRDRDAISRAVPRLGAGPWQELPIEFVAGNASLLTARGSGANLPVVVTLTEPDAASPAFPDVRIDRTLVQAQWGDEGQRYRTRFHLARWQGGHLDLEIPAAAADVEVRVQGSPVEPREASAEAEGGRVVRVPLPAWQESRQLLVDLVYRLPAAPGGEFFGLISRWQPPRPRGRVQAGVARWQVAIPSHLIPLSTGGAEFEEQWVVRGGRAQVVPVRRTADLEKWITQGIEPGEPEAGEWDAPAYTVAARQPALGTLRMVLVPRLAWYALVSFAVLVAGLFLSRIPGRFMAAILGLFVVAMLIAGLTWPQPVGQVLMAAQPGAAILVVVLAVQQFVQWRYRRRLQHMPGFSRMHTESGISRSNGKKPAPQTSTVDSPAAG